MPATPAAPTIDVSADLKQLAQRIEGLEAQLAEKSQSLPLFTHASIEPTAEVVSSLAVVREDSSAILHNDAFYQAMEAAFRGSDEAITQRQAQYLPSLNTARATEQQPVLDLGCGRGEFLRLLHKQNVPCIGVDPNVKHIEELRQQGFDAHQMGGVEYLETREAASLSAIVSFQVIEHVELDYLERLLKLAMHTLVDDGQLLLETVNPYCLPTYRTFYVDPTHVRPLPVDLLSMLMWAAGFTELQVFYQNPVLLPNNVESTVSEAYQTYAVLGKRPSR
jgi:O-antigen chain-terminating methyltransferase